MTRASRGAVAVGAAGLVLLAAGCGTARPSEGAAQTLSPALSLATAVTTAGGTWAVAVAGGTAASHNNFWQLLVRPGASRTWRLVTPPGVASNGGLVIAPVGSQALTTAFRPSQALAFTPLAATTSLGRRWTPGVLDAGLADVPSALAADPATGHMLALLAGGTVEQSNNHGVTWTRLTSYRTIRAIQPARTCRLQNLTAVAFAPAGQPLLGGTCARPGTTPIFSLTAHGWRPAEQATLPSAAGQPVAVLMMAANPGGRTIALLQAGTGSSRTLIAAWSPADGNVTGAWTLSPPQPLRGATVLSVSTGSDESVAAVLSARAALVDPRPGAAWQPLPRLPARTQTVAIGPGTAIQAIAPSRSAIAIWSVSQPAGRWALVQHMAVPIQYGSSG